MRTFYIISETEMKEVGMMPPELEPPDLFGAIDRNYARSKKWHDHLAAAQTFQHRLNKKGLVSEEEFVWGWYVKTESYQGEGHHVFKTEKEAIENYKEWSKWNGTLQSFTHKPVKVAIPKEEKEERMFTEKEVMEAITELYKEDFGDLRDDSIERDGYFILGFVTSALTKYLKQ